ncbi:MAG: hypothetical protein AB4042_08155 [Leptolyngbyaceae cyanobacterium]
MGRNKLEIRVCGLQRSGNHAIINWIRGQYQGAKTCFLNNVRHGAYDPFCHATQVFTYNFAEFPDGRVREFLSQDLKSMDKDLLIYSYEDDRYQVKKNTGIIDSFYHKEFEDNRTTYLGDSQHFIDILVVRDPYNLIASRLKQIDKLTGVKDINLIIDFSKDTLRKATDFEKNQDANKIVIKYNQWFSDKDYRQQLSQQLGGNFNDSSLGEVSSTGGGSSFDGTRFNKKLRLQDIPRKWKKLFQLRTYKNLGDYWYSFMGAKQMKTLDRWKSIDEPIMQKILTDPEISELSTSLFGDILNP